MIYLFFAAIGIMAVGIMPELPSIYTVVVLLILSLLLIALRVYHFFRLWLNIVFGLTGALGLGLSWGIFYGLHILQQQWPESCEDGNFVVQGYITGLPRKTVRGHRFAFMAESIKPVQAIVKKRKAGVVSPVAWWSNTTASQSCSFSAVNGDVFQPFHRKILLYRTFESESPSVQPGQYWRFQVRLRRPRGFSNPGGYDYHAWLLQAGFSATGFVKSGQFTHVLEKDSRFSIHMLRMHVSQLLTADSTILQGGILAALAVGDRSHLTQTDWQLLQNTGTVHLMAISGLHIGMLAFVGYFTGSALARLVLLFHPYSRLSVIAGPISSIMSALFYSAMAGFSIPTQRALLLVIFVNTAVMLHKPVNALRSLLIIFLLVLIHSPLAGYSSGFWLSFIAVAVLLIAFSGRKFCDYPKQILILMQSVRSQWVVFFGLLIPLILLGQGISLIAPLANIVAITLVSWIVVPALLLSVLCMPFSPAVASYPLSFADMGIDITLQFLTWCNRWGDSLWFISPGDQHAKLLLAVTGCVLLLLPKALPGRWLGYVLLFTVLLPDIKRLVKSYWFLKPVYATFFSDALSDMRLNNAKQPGLKVTVLDVGQGLAVVIQTPNHTLLYDTGPAYSHRFDAGNGIIVPYLYSQGLHAIDRLMISHGDKDHSGGVASVIKMIDVKDIFLSEKLPAISNPQTYCAAGQRWRWDGVEFEVLSPSADISGQTSHKMMLSENNRSCVLLIRYGGKSILLPGDIEAPVEQQLLDHPALRVSVDVVLAPHHGSKTSSTFAFLNRLQPDYVVYSAGYRSRYGHPHKSVVGRYRQLGATPLSTVHHGACTFLFYTQGPFDVRSYRQDARRYWFTKINNSLPL